MITTNPYCVLQDVKDSLALKTTTNDAWIQSLIPQAQAVVDNEVGYSFQQDGTSASPTIRYFSGNDRQELFVGTIIQITQVMEKNYSLAVDGSGFFNVQNYYTNDITQDCYIGPDNRNPGWRIERLSENLFNRGKRNYQVSGVWGFASVPPDITRATTRIVTHWIKMRDTSYADTLAEQGNVRQKYTKKLPEDVVEILQNYTLTRFYST